MNTVKTTYTAFLLRLWQTKHSVTRIILQNVHTGEEHWFNCMADFITFLESHDEGGNAEETTAQLPNTLL